MSGIGGEVSNIDKLLGLMKQYCDDKNDAQNAKREKAWKRVKEDECLGTGIRYLAIKRCILAKDSSY